MNYLALDIGQVLCHVDQYIFANVASETLNISVSDINRFTSRFWELHDLGYTNIQDELIEKLNVKSDIIIKKLADAWSNVVFPNETVINFINNLRNEHNVKIALLSNIGIEHAEVMKTMLSKGGLYSDSIKHFSCAVGARKPSYLYYQSFLSMYPEFKGCFYVDDLQKNIEAGALLGFKCYKFDLANFYPFQNSMWTLEQELEKLKTNFLESIKST